MKHLINFIISIILVIPCAQAQLNTGSKFIAGNNNFSFHRSGEKLRDGTADPVKYFEIDMTAKAGYFLKNRIAIGGLIEYNYTNSKQAEPESNLIERGWLVGPLARYYVEYGTVIPFAEASLGFGRNVSKSEYVGSPAFEEKSPVFAIKGGIGADFFLNESIAFEGMLYYFHNTIKYDAGETFESVYNENGIGATFGIIFYFGTI